MGLNFICKKRRKLIIQILIHCLTKIAGKSSKIEKPTLSRIEIMELELNAFSMEEVLDKLIEINELLISSCNLE